MQQPEIPLRDIHSVPAPGWWPPAWGWWLLMGLALLALIFAGYKGWLWLKRRRHQARLLLEVDQIVNQWHADRHDARAIAALSVLLRRLVVHAGGRKHLAGAAGDLWVDELKQAVADQPDLLAAAQTLAIAPYQRETTDADIPAMAQLARRWAVEVSRV